MADHTDLPAVLDRPPAVPIHSGGPVRAIVPQDFDSVWRLSLAVCKAGMAPKGLDSPERVMIAVMHGLEVGLTPMAALQSIAIINNRPVIWGDGAIALVLASPKCAYVHESYDNEAGAEFPDELTAVCEVLRRSDDTPLMRTFSVADAKKAGLWTKTGRNGEPTPWQTYPKRMLRMRARAFSLRDAFADVLKGLGIAEEVMDYATFDAPRAAAPKAVRPPPRAIRAAPDKTAETVTNPEAKSDMPLEEERDHTATVEKAQEMAEEPSNLDEKINMPSGFDLDELKDRLLEARDEETLQEVWEHYGAAEQLAGNPTALTRAMTEKAKRLRQIRQAAAVA